ncbi:hypothetical protein [Plantactinospora endophytica]|uniref:Uncharacterized protein n=1 Tax=Plantactinospora endophytica TaxID=673535 RepID=A0ABQ4DSJ6_9ACTN|nr:hypothetical protein [Plantactinospora endophytica]GIG85421.1 hypothetical protein Pen02_03570 [Plantactinospora endophytica]
MERGPIKRRGMWRGGWRRRLLGTVTAAVLATGLAVPGTARPAQAVDAGTIIAVAQFAQAAYSYFNSAEDGGMTIEEATSRILVEIGRTRDTIMAHLDALATAEARACAEHHLLEFADIEEFPLSLKQRWAQDVTSCVTLINSLWGAVSTLTAKNQLGIALGTVGPIALVARAQARLGTTELKNLLIGAFERVQQRFVPYCHATPNVTEVYWEMNPYPSWVDAWYTCAPAPEPPYWSENIGSYTVYEMGLWSWGTPVNYNWQAVMDGSKRHSAYVVAESALTHLRA